MNLIKIYFIAVLYFLTPVLSVAQQADTLNAEQEIVDTVVVKKAPYIIKRTVVVDKKRTTKIVSGLDLFFNVNQYTNYISSCEVCKTYVDKVKGASSPTLSYGVGFGYTLYRKWLYLSLGVNYNSFRERFNYTDSAGTSYNQVNSLNYLGLSMGAGVKIFSTKKTEIFIISEGGAVKLITSNGNVLTTSGVPEVTNAKSADMYNQYNYNILGGLRINYHLSNYFKLSATPYYQGDLWTVTKPSHPYLQQKQVFGIRIGIFYIL